LSKRNARGSLEGSLDEDVEGHRKGLAFALDYG
jgi:hypothetical protein